MEIIIKTTLLEILKDIDNIGHEAFMAAENSSETSARAAMTDRIGYYKNLIKLGKIKLIPKTKK